MIFLLLCEKKVIISLKKLNGYKMQMYIIQSPVQYNYRSHIIHVRPSTRNAMGKHQVEFEPPSTDILLVTMKIR